MLLCSHPLTLLAMFNHFELLAFTVSTGVCRLLGFYRLVDTICYSEHWYLWHILTQYQTLWCRSWPNAIVHSPALTFKYSKVIIVQAWAMKGGDWLLNENIETLIYSAWMNATERKEVCHHFEQCFSFDVATDWVLLLADQSQWHEKSFLSYYLLNLTKTKFKADWLNFEFKY